METPDHQKRPKHIKDKRLVFSHKNLQRWALFSTVPNLQERVLARHGANGEIIEKVIIGSIMVNGKPRTLSTEEGAMMNLIEGLHHRFKPTDGILRVPTTAFYDYVVDVASFNDPDKRKKRDGVTYRNYVYDRLYTMTAVPIMYTDWKEKTGEGGAKRFNLLDGFKMYGKTKDAAWGIIEITINPVVAAGLRAKHTSPVLIEVANSMNTPTAWALYRYLDKVLSKRTKFEISVDEYIKRLVMTERKDKCLDKIRAAIKEIEESDWKKDLTCGRIISLKLEKIKDRWWIIAERGRRQPIKSQEYIHEAADQQKKEEQIGEYVLRFNVLPDEAKKSLEPTIAAKIASKQNRFLKPGSLMYETMRNEIIAEVMEAYLMKEINLASKEFCSEAPRLVVREPPCLNPYKGAGDIRRETKHFLRMLYPPLPLLTYNGG